MTDWSIDNPGGNGRCRHPVSKARNYTRRHIQKGGEKYVWSYFGTEFRTSYSSNIELCENADHCLQFSEFMNIMCRSSVGLLNGRLMNRKIWIYENTNRDRTHIVINRGVFEPRHSRFRALQHSTHLRTNYNVRLQQGILQFFSAPYTVIILRFTDVGTSCDVTFTPFHMTSRNDPVVTMFYKNNFLCKYISVSCIVTNSTA